MVTIKEIEQQQRQDGDARFGAALRDEAKQLEAELSDGPVAATELKKRANANGHSWRIVRRAQEELEIRPHQQDRNWFWQLPD